ncbi:hypothetical protein AX17_005891 [Amanita inopinata Kibby_2008]|nr:hypothetical protein AX17_005891 [Amanita inopinata Kibby_2008]
MNAPQSSFSIKQASTIGLWVEVLLYGIYVCLFMETLYIMFKKRVSTGPVLMFKIVTVVMFFVATAHVAINLHHFLRPSLPPPAATDADDYRPNIAHWDTLARTILMCIMSWLGNTLVVYRCYIIWNESYLIITIPVVLLIADFVMDIVVLCLTTHPRATSFKHFIRWLSPIYPLAFAQNTITTLLIAFKLWKTHRSSKSAGAHNVGSPLGLVQIMRIVVESALLYTIQLLILIILGSIKHNAQFIIQASVVPSIGIVFGLIAVRVHLKTAKSLWSQDAALSGMTNWLEENLRNEDSEHDTIHTPERSVQTELGKYKLNTYESGHSSTLRIDTVAPGV